MTARLVIIADDLSGAADCGVVCAAAGLDTVVMLGGRDDEPEVDVLAIDGDTRSRSRADAVAETRLLVQRHAPAGRTLFRKVDSTLRGHIAAELAATLDVRRAQGRAQDRVLAVLAPAFPATGRTTRGGHQHLHGVRLEHTEVWRRDGIAGRAHLVEMLAEVDLAVAAIDLAAIRGGNLEAVVRGCARHSDVLVFDAETEHDLAAAAAAAARLGDGLVWAGSAGLARHLPQVLAARSRVDVDVAALPTRRPVLLVIGSASAVSRDQRDCLAAAPDLVVVDIPAALLRAGPAGPDWSRHRDRLHRALAAGHDAAVAIGDDGSADPAQGPALCRALAGLAAGAVHLAGSLVLTGGETARAVLQSVGVSGLRLVGEVEPGVPLALALGRGGDRGEPFPVITKAGAFGSPQTLARCRAVLRGTATSPPVPEIP